MNSQRPPEPHTALDLSRGEPLRGVVFVLRVSAGPDLGASIMLDGINEGRVLLGQSAMCTLRLTDPTASRRHAALRRDDRAWRLEDLGSTNGTRVNGVRIKEAYLVGGELVTLGATSLRLTRAGVAPVDDHDHPASFGRFVGSSAEVRGHFAHWARLAATREPILIEGEPGTGKERLAESLHDAGPRASGPFVVLECRGRSDADVAAAIHRSIFDQAAGGTLVVDEPAELSNQLQEQLLALLRVHQADVRLITTTRRDLDAEVQAGRFSEALLDALGVVNIELPPLRRRSGDMEVLAAHFWRQLGGAGEVPPPELRKLANRTWPGNVRELLQVIVELLAMSGDAERGGSERDASSSRARSSSSLTSDAITRVLAMELPFVRARQELMREFQARYVESTLQKHGGNVSRAAAASGLARRYFQILRARTR